jgi:hypothetical protein
MCIFRSVFYRVKMPISLATSGQFKDCMEAINKDERRENLPFDSADFAVF